MIHSLPALKEQLQRRAIAACKGESTAGVDVTVVSIIAFHLEKATGYAELNVSTIAEESPFSLRTVHRSIDRIVKKGILKRTRRGPNASRYEPITAEQDMPPVAEQAEPNDLPPVAEQDVSDMPPVADQEPGVDLPTAVPCSANRGRAMNLKKNLELEEGTTEVVSHSVLNPETPSLFTIAHVSHARVGKPKTFEQGKAAEAGRRFDEELWPSYPRHVAKKPAREIFVKLVLRGTSADEIIAGVRAYAASVVGTDEKHIAHATTFLNQERWKDEHTPQSRGRGSGGRLVDYALRMAEEEALERELGH